MRKPNVLSTGKALPRMSWSAQNLYNLIARSQTAKSGDLSWKQTSASMYQQRVKSKRFLRAYHGDHIPERRFKRWFLPLDLPSFDNPTAAGSRAPRLGGMFAGARRTASVRDAVRKEAEGPLPIASLFVREVERRLDTVVFRSCFARSIYEARALVVQGKVRCNGSKLSDPNHLLEPGDLISLDAASIPMLSIGEAKAAEARRKFEETAAAAAEEEAKSKSSSGEARSEAADKPAEETAAPKGGEGEAATEAPTEQSSAEAAPAETQEASTSEASSSTSTGKADSKSKSQKLFVPKQLPPGVFPFHLPRFAAPHLFVPPYLEVSFSTCSAIYMRHPTLTSSGSKVSSDIPSPYPADSELFSLTWEHYAENAPRIRSDLRRLQLESRVGRNGFATQRSKDEWKRKVAVRRGWIKRMGAGVTMSGRTGGVRRLGQGRDELRRKIARSISGKGKRDHVGIAKLEHLTLNAGAKLATGSQKAIRQTLKSSEA